MKVNVSNSPSPHSAANRIARVVWDVVWLLLYRPSPGIFHGWRRFLLRLFRARIGRGAHPHPSARIWGPWNLEMGDHSCLSHDVDCYCVTRIAIGPHATVSQYSYLCAASHDIEDPHMRLIAGPITIGAGAWIAAAAFLGPGVTVGEGAVVGACAVVMEDVQPWTVVAGNPARVIKTRILRS